MKPLSYSSGNIQNILMLNLNGLRHEADAVTQGCRDFIIRPEFQSTFPSGAKLSSVA